MSINENKLNIADACYICQQINPLIHSDEVIRIKNEIVELHDHQQTSQTLKQQIIEENSKRKIDQSYTLQFIEKNNVININNHLRDLVKVRDKASLDISVHSLIVDKKQEELEILESLLIQKEMEYALNVDILNQFETSIGTSIQYLEKLRWHRALEIFVMMKIITSTPISNYSEKFINMSESSTILGLPLPNHGNYQQCPIDIVTSALGHICHLVDAISATLNIPLPHQTHPFKIISSSCIETNDLTNASLRENIIPLQQCYRNNRAKDFDGLSWDTLENTYSQFTQHPFSWKVHPSFDLGLELVQENVIHLCIRAGLSSDMLYPVTAVLPNLFKLHLLCLENVRKMGSLSYDLSYTAFPLELVDIPRLSKRYSQKKINSLDYFEEDIIEKIELIEDSDWALVHVTNDLNSPNSPATANEEFSQI